MKKLLPRSICSYKMVFHAPKIQILTTTGQGRGVKAPRKIGVTMVVDPTTMNLIMNAHLNIAQYKFHFLRMSMMSKVLIYSAKLISPIATNIDTLRVQVTQLLFLAL